MAPITIHKNAPIAPVTAAKPDGIIPSTASSDPAQNPPPTRTTPAYTPATTTASSSEPPPPQPGARPAAPTGSAYGAGGYNASSPAPPQPGPTATFVTTETRQGGPPPQFTYPPPSNSALAGKSTVTSTKASKPGPTTLNYGPAASPFQSADTGGAVPTQTRTSVEAGRTSLEQHPSGYIQAPDNAPFTVGGGIGERQGGSSGQEQGVGAAAWGMLSKAGEALKKGEEAAWRAVKGK